ncbi:ABC transporter ATP-binding protein [Paratractidigestivibacter faecalis]|uniref:ABC transporter ATP-binding protein n=1 Tax=Paratractidigestivibacter faecalis TaxID=2292441 RepID=A0ABV1IEY1_9ACTN
MRRRGYSIAANASFSFFFNALYVVALTWCALELVGGAMSYGTLMAVLQLVGRIQAPVSSLSGMMPQLYQTLAPAESLMEVAGLPCSEDGLGLSAAEFYRRFVGVRMRGLVFAYGDEGAVPAGGEEDACEEAADNKASSLTCSDAFVPKGSFVVVEEPSGSGKSTLFKLALGAYNADGFAYELEEGASCAASQVPAGVFAYVPQDNFLFAGTVRENVAFAAPDANDDQVRRACEAACAWDFVEELPLGLDTAIGEHGQGLSQGQLRRARYGARRGHERTRRKDRGRRPGQHSRLAGKDGLRRRAPREGPRVLHPAPSRGRRGCERGGVGAGMSD